MRLFVFVAMLFAASIAAVSADGAKHYIFDGYSLSGVKGIDAHALEAKLKHKLGARVTRADIAEDEAIVLKEAKAHHLEGHLFTTFAEKKGHLWVIFDLLNPRPRDVFSKPHHFEAQRFEGATRIPASTLSAATGLRSGDLLSPEKINGARRAILAAYAKSVPGKTINVVCRMQTKPDGKATLTWVIREPQ
jgi:outer membrane protein assembly factor BamA